MSRIAGEPGGGCFEPEDAALAIGLGEDDPRRRHLESCARCGALAAAYRSFEAAEPAAGARPDEAAASLAAFLGREVLAAGAPARAARGLRQRTGRRPAPRRLGGAGGRLHAGLAAAAVLLAAGGLWLLQGGGDRPGGIVLRGEGEGTPPGPTASFSASAGALELRWAAVPEADAYEVRILDPAFSILRRLPAAGPELVLPAGSLTALARLPGPLFVQVVALAEGDEIAVGPPAPLPAAVPDRRP